VHTHLEALFFTFKGIGFTQIMDMINMHKLVATSLSTIWSPAPSTTHTCTIWSLPHTSDNHANQNTYKAYKNMSNSSFKSAQQSLALSFTVCNHRSCASKASCSSSERI
jgi:hypothetical protein